MLYYFIINGRSDIREKVDAVLDAELPKVGIQYRKYYTKGVGDGTRFVRLNCDLHQKEVTCYVACGGSGTANEVASGIVGFPTKLMGFLAFGETNDTAKYWPDRCFSDVKGLVDGTPEKVDIIKIGDNYALNVINVGFEGAVAYGAAMKIDEGMPATKAYRDSIVRSVLSHRLNFIRITADGKRLNRRAIMSCPIGNGIWCGGQYRCCPNAINDDGLMEVIVMRPMLLLSFVILLSNYTKGTHLVNRFCRKRINYCQARHVELESRDLIYVCLDGETYASTKFSLDVLPGAINFILPPKQ